MATPYGLMSPFAGTVEATRSTILKRSRNTFAASAVVDEVRKMKAGTVNRIGFESKLRKKDMARSCLLVFVQTRTRKRNLVDALPPSQRCLVGPGPAMLQPMSGST